MTDAGSLEMALANGQRLLAANPAAAAEQAREILSKNEHNREGLRLLARALHRLGQKQEAQRAEVKAVEAAAHNPTLVSVSRESLRAAWTKQETGCAPTFSDIPTTPRL